MNTFIQKYQPKIKGTLSGWDRIMFRGCLRALSYVEGMGTYLKRVGCLLKDFGEHVETLTGQLIEKSLQRAEEWRLLFQQADKMIQEAFDEEKKYVSQGTLEGPIEHPEISVETAYPHAKEWLAQQGKTDEEIAAMSKEKVVGLQMVHDVEIAWGNQFNAIYLPIWERANWDEIEQFYKRLLKTSPYACYFGNSIVPAIEAGRNAFRRVQLQNDTLRISQALRISMAENAGKLPETLSDIKSVPVPMIDPYTGKPFRYRLENGVGIIEVPEHTYPLTVYFEP